MDAVEFCKEEIRMCKSFACDECPVNCRCNRKTMDAVDVELYITAVEQWAKEHPVKTRQSEFLRLFPRFKLHGGIVLLNPCTMDRTLWERCLGKTGSKDCKKCRRDYWMQEVE